MKSDGDDHNPPEIGEAGARFVVSFAKAWAVGKVEGAIEL